MGSLLGAFIFFFFPSAVLWSSKHIFTSNESFKEGQYYCNMTHHLTQFSDTRGKWNFLLTISRFKHLTLLFSAFCQIQGTHSIKMQIYVLIQKEHLILKIRYSLLSSSLLQLFVEFSMFIDQKHATKLLETTMDYAAELKFLSYHPNAVLLQTATEKHL